jgi:hypothetical protein
MNTTIRINVVAALLSVVGAACEAPLPEDAAVLEQETAAVVPTIDAFNLTAPSAVETTTSSNPYVFARRSDGNICVIRLFGGTWSCLGAPAGGTTSGPSAAAMPDSNNPFGPVKWTFLFVRGSAGQIFERHLPGGSPWTNWSTAMWSAPPGGTNSAPVARNGNYVLSLAVRSSGNQIFERSTTSSGDNGLPSLDSWKTNPAGGGEAMISAPAPAVNDFKRDLLALGSQATVRQSFCGFPTCFNNWTSFGNSTVFKTSMSALWYTDANFDLINAVAGVDTNGRVRLGKYNYYSGQFTGYTDLGLPNGVQATSAPALVPTTSGGVTELIVVVFNADGNYWYRNTKSGQSWVGIGHP